MAEPLSIPSSAVRVQRPRLSRIFSLLFTLALLSPALISMLIAIAAMLHVPGIRSLPPVSGETLAWAWFLGTPALAILSSVTGAWAPARAGLLEVTPGGVDVVRGRARELIRSADIEAGLLVPTRTGATEVELHLRDGRVIRAAVENERDAHAVLDQLSLGAGRRRVAVEMGGSNRAMLAGCATFLPSTVAAVIVLTAAVLNHLDFGASFVLATVIAALPPLLAHFAARPTSVVVGSDAVILRRSFGDRLVPLADIKSVWSLGTELKILVQAPPGRFADETITVRGSEAALASGLVDRIKEAMARHGAGASAHAAAELEPGERSFADWREALAVIIKRGADYRRAALGAEDLLAVLDDVAAPPARRIGAAIALRDGDHPEAQTRVRIAAEACADEEMRAALEAAAAEEMDEEPIRRVMDRR